MGFITSSVFFSLLNDYSRGWLYRSLTIVSRLPAFLRLHRPVINGAFTFKNLG